MRLLPSLVLISVATSATLAAQSAAIPGALVEEMPTLSCLGVRWYVGGDDNANAVVTVAYRRTGASVWRRGLDLFRVDPAGMRTPPPGKQVMHAGSVFDLQEDTDYEVRLSLQDPDGGSEQRTVNMSTWSEPRRPIGGDTVCVVPGGLAAALAAAKPGDVIELASGVYAGTFAPRSGAPGQPIAIVGPADRSAVIDGGGNSNALGRSRLQHVIFENLTVQNARYGMAFNEGAHITVRRCTIRDVDYAFVAQRDGTRQQRILIADNDMIGRATWPRTAGIESRRGVQLGGTGHVVCHNRIRAFADAIDVYGAYPTAAIDFCGNEISECTDDGIEMDYSEHNTRCFDNRCTNIYQGISLQPVHGGPVYVFRNSLYNVVGSTFKLNNSPSGGVLYHNTSVKAGMPRVLNGASVFNTISRNNLFIGTTGNYAYESTARMVECDFDHDGYGGIWGLFLKWNGVRYATIEAVRQSAPVYSNVVEVDPTTAFASGLAAPSNSSTQFSTAVHDARLAAGTTAIDAGVLLANINDGFSGAAPDLGAFELGGSLPHYGPRPARARLEIIAGTPAPGSTVQFVLTTEGDGDAPYQLLSSLGTGPTPIGGGRVLGLSVGPLFHGSASGLFPSLFAGYAGLLSETGRARAALHLPNTPALIGLSIHSAFVTWNTQPPWPIRAVSNTASVQI